MAAAHDPAMLSHGAATAGWSASDDVDADSAPVFLWLVSATGAVTAHSPGAPGLPVGLLAAHPPHDGLAVTTGLGKTGAVRLTLHRDAGSCLVPPPRPRAAAPTD